MKQLLSLVAPILVTTGLLVGQMDQDNNLQSDIWEMLYQAPGLLPHIDSDGDGFTNEEESIAGTNPLDPDSHPRLEWSEGRVAWFGILGKQYVLEQLDETTKAWVEVNSWSGSDATIQYTPDANLTSAVFRVLADDQDSDGDELSDWEESILGLSPTNPNTRSLSQNDFDWVAERLPLTSVFRFETTDAITSETLLEPELLVIRRISGLAPVNLRLALSGTATPGIDYVSVPTVIPFAPGQESATLSITPNVDSDDDEGSETVIITIQPDPAYEIGSPSSATVVIEDAPSGDLPTAAETARFLMQTTYGPSMPLIESVRQAPFASWIEAQFAQPIGRHQPIIENMSFPEGGPYDHHRTIAWWENAVRGPDPLRQRVAFALSEIFVISDNTDALSNQVIGMLNYYDMLLSNSFGNFRDLIEDVTFHPTMGLYLSHLGNRPPNPDTNTFPDENYAREIMQLFSIGLWELNTDGTYRLDSRGERIPTYNNNDITNLARVFTGISWGTGDPSDYWTFWWPDGSQGVNAMAIPMKVWNGPYRIWQDSGFVNVYLHDQDSKTLLGVNLPANNPASPDPDYATNDIERALDILFNHPNVGPFIAQHLIQRMVTSNPSPGYIRRVAEAFNGEGPHNPGNVRGDMRSVIRALFLDPEARSLSQSSVAHFGKQRVPYLRLTALIRAFEMVPAQGRNYEFFWIGDNYGMQPLSSPSVFNFYLPDYQPPGPVKQLGYVAPEFQITNAVTTVTQPNHMYWHIWGTFNPANGLIANIQPLLDAASDTETLIAYLNLLLCYGQMSTETQVILREAINHPNVQAAPALERAHFALILVATSPDSIILR